MSTCSAASRGDGDGVLRDLRLALHRPEDAQGECPPARSPLVGRFNYASDPDKAVIDLTAAHIWDASSVAALDSVGTKYAERGKKVEIIGLNDPSADLHDKLSGELTSH